MGRSLVVLSLVSITACGGPAQGEDGEGCGAEDIIDLYEGSSISWQAEPAGAHVLIVLESPSGAAYRQPSKVREVRAVPKCGGPEAVLERSHVTSKSVVRDFGVIGGHIVSCDEATDRMEVHDPTGESSPRVLFEDSPTCSAVAVGGGIASVDAYGDLLFAEAPGDPQGVVRRLLSGARHHGGDLTSFDEVPHACDPTILRVVGDHLLVAMTDGGLVEVDPISGASHVYTSRRIVAICVMDDARHVVWTDDEENAFWLDRDRDVSVLVGNDTQYDPIGCMGDWIVDAVPFPPFEPLPSDEWSVVSSVDVESGASFTLHGRGHWWSVATLSPDAVIIEGGADDDLLGRVDHVLWPATGELVPIDFPGNNHDVLHRYRGGLATLLRFPWEHFGTLRALAADGRTLETLSERVPSGVRFLRDDRIAWIEDSDVDGIGDLVVLMPDGDVVHIDREVEWILWPPEELGRHRTPDAAMLIYRARDGDQSIVRRARVP